VPVGTPPIDELVHGGKRLRRRRRLRAAGGAAAMTLAVVTGSALATGTVLKGDASGRQDQVAASDIPTAPDRHRLVGLGRVVVAVPAGWATNAFDDCSAPTAATVWFELEDSTVKRDCVPALHQVPSVMFTWSYRVRMSPSSSPGPSAPRGRWAGWPTPSGCFPRGGPPSRLSRGRTWPSGNRRSGRPV
jgi:hypothetical protein